MRAGVVVRGGSRGQQERGRCQSRQRRRSAAVPESRFPSAWGGPATG